MTDTTEAGQQTAGQAAGQAACNCKAHHSSSATIFFLRSGLTVMEPGALCWMRRCSLRLSESCTIRRILEACANGWRDGKGRSRREQQQAAPWRRIEAGSQ
eukprot:GHRQ01039658.1.p2 GENE.GHRQ01039658.1~~GHRQ01039658.1.p2  ORF type:complete len:101 (+),score=21.23 GHRQ01039658.1:95-397(+)